MSSHEKKGKKYSKTALLLLLLLLVNLEEKRWNCCNFYCISGIKNCIFVSMCSFLCCSFLLDPQSSFPTISFETSKKQGKSDSQLTDTKVLIKLERKLIGAACSTNSFSFQKQLVFYNWNCMSKCTKIEKNQINHLLTLFENYSKCRNWIFQFWHFPPIFVLLKLTCLVTLFDRKLQVFKNSSKLIIFGTL